MKRIGLVLVALALATMSWTQASAEGALALGQPRDIARHGVAIGMADSLKTSKVAAATALQQCKSSDVKAPTRALCQVVRTFSKQCSAVAMDPKVGTPGFGWAVAKTKTAAASQALSNCKATAGFARRNACRVAGTSCDS
jgi:Domain of unknown function (DUF4189)